MKKIWVRSIIYLIVIAIGVIWILSRGTGNPEKIITRTTPRAEKTPLREAMFYENLGGNKVRCQICFRRCIINEGKRGLCRNKENRAGVLYNIVYARPSAVHVDPIEKEPQLHMLPGTKIRFIRLIRTWLYVSQGFST